MNAAQVVKKAGRHCVISVPTMEIFLDGHSIAWLEACNLLRTYLIKSHILEDE